MKNLQKLFALILVFALSTNTVFAAFINVDTNADDPTTALNACTVAAGDCSLRGALSIAGSGDSIGFGSDMIITPSTGYSIGTPLNLNGVAGGRVTQIDGSSLLSGVDILNVTNAADGATIKGMYLYGNAAGGNNSAIRVDSGAVDVIIGGAGAGEGNVIGLKPGDITTFAANTYGIRSAGSNISVIGNTISNNTQTGLFINGGSDFLVQGNKIGTTSTGNTISSNGADGIALTGPTTINGGNGGTEGLIIGGTTGEGNTISGNGNNGIKIGGAGSTITGTVKIQGNHIGVGSNGTTAITNGANGGGRGIYTDSTSSGVDFTIGATGEDTGEMNTISNNIQGGIFINDATSINIQGNSIGFDSTGAGDHGNGDYGIKINAPSATVINIGNGGAAVTHKNYIGNSSTSLNNSAGALEIDNSANNATIKIQNNVIGLAADLTTLAGNITNGIYLSAPGNYIIGTDNDSVTDANEFNVISANEGNGIKTVNGIHGVTIAGNYIGLKSGDGGITYNAAAGNGTGISGELNGITIDGASITSLAIGGSNAVQRNYISSNLGHGVSIFSATSSSIAVSVLNNYIGLGGNGLTALGNTRSGINIANGGALSIINNVIGNNNSGNSGSYDGVYISGGTGLTFTGNKVGTDSAGLAPKGNGNGGLSINDTSMTSLVIGGSSSTDSNVFAASAGSSTASGITIQDLAPGATATIQGNYVGIGADGTTTTGLGNAGKGIYLAGAIATLVIGGNNDLAHDILAEGNIISNNGYEGIVISGGSAGVSNASVYGNLIGVKLDGTTAAGNGSAGISFAVDAGTINIGEANGTTTASKRNIISNNAFYGIYSLLNSGLPGVANGIIKIKNNYIGTDKTGSVDLGNEYGGISLSSGTGTQTLVIGTDLDSVNDDFEGNLISGNNKHLGSEGNGISIRTTSLGLGKIYGNIIGLNLAKTAKLANDDNGVQLDGISGSSIVNVGNISLLGRNYISGNGDTIAGTGGGVTISISSADAIVSVLGNVIGLDGTLTSALGNANSGVEIGNNTIGTINVGGSNSTEKNYIGGNGSTGSLGNGIGILVVGASGSIVNIIGNMIGLNGDGNAAIPNLTYGILTAGDGTYNIGDGTTDGKNIISGNTGAGIGIWGGNTTILRNLIGVAADGATALVNGGYSIDVNTHSGFGNISALKIGSATSPNTINNTSRVGAYIDSDNADFKTWNETNNSFNTDNSWTSTSSPTYNYWERYVNAVLANYGPQAAPEPVIVVVDNNNSGGGGGSLPSHPSTPRTNTNTDNTTTDTTITTDIPVDNTTPVEDNLKDFVIKQKLNEAINVTSDTITGKDEVNLDLLINPSINPYTSQVVEKTPEQIIVSDGLDKIDSGEKLSSNEQKKVERTASSVIQKSVGDLFKKAEIGGSKAPIISVSLANGKKKTLSRNTQIEFALDANAALDNQEKADSNGQDKVYLTPYSIIGDNNVSALLQVMEGGSIGDKYASDKIFFKGLSGLADEVDSIEKLLPTKPEITNLQPGMEVSPEFLLWVAGPKAEDVSAFAVDKVDPANPKSWKIYDMGKYAIDGDHKTALALDLSAKMDKPIKKFTIVVQDKNGKGSSQEVTVNKDQTMKLNSVSLQNGNNITFADIATKNKDLNYLGKLLVKDGVIQVQNNKNADPKMIAVRGYSEPGSVVFVTWKSILTTSTVIADTNGYFEVQVPKEVEAGDHTAYTYSYNKGKKTASNFAKIIFAKFF